MRRKQKESNVSDAIRRSHRFKDLTGQKFNMLTVIKVDRFTPHGTYWLCKCDCGELNSVRTDMLTSNKIKSCGCIKYLEGFKNKFKIKNTKIYTAWKSMKDRCYNPNHPQYKNYGGRGIKVCDEWLDKEKGFINFYNWAYSHNFIDTRNRAECTLDRIDVNGNYEPSNCRWASSKTQANNRRNNYYIEYEEEVHTLQEWSEKLPINISSSVLRGRLKRGWTIKKAFTTSVNKNCNRWKHRK